MAVQACAFVDPPLPNRQRGNILPSVHDTCLVALFLQFWHSLQVRAASHVSTHGRLIAPQRHGPERELTVWQQGAFKEPMRLLALPLGVEWVQRETRHEPNRADTQPGNADKGRGIVSR